MRKLTLLLAVLVFPLFLAAKTTTIYHTSDTHGFFYPRNGQGGFGALAAVLKNGPQPYLLLDSGDFANGTIETRTSKGLKAVTLMNRVGYNASTVGNHEFDFKNDQFAHIAAELNFPLLAANFFEKDTLKYPPHVKPYEIFDVGGVKVAVIGLANRTPTNPATSYVYTDPFEALENALEKAEKQNPQIVVVIVHDSINDQRHGDKPYVSDIAKKFGGRVHVVLGGHAHVIVQNHVENGVLFAESGYALQNVSKVTVKTDDKTGKVTSVKSELIPLVIAKTGQDPLITAYADSLREPGADEEIGSTAEKLAKDPKAGEMDSPLNDWIVDLIRDYAKTDIAIHNNGGTRVDLPKGKITRRDIIEVHPFDNQVSRVTVDGKFLKKFIRAGFSPRSLFTYSGLQITYKVNKKGKIKGIKIYFNGRPLKNRQKYTIATNAYIAGGGSEGKMFKQIPDDQKEIVGKQSIRTLMEDAFKKGVVSAPATGRMAQR